MVYEVLVMLGGVVGVDALFIQYDMKCLQYAKKSMDSQLNLLH